MAVAATPRHVFGRAFYARVTVMSFALGAAMELFMIKTGFYAKVTDLEAQRRADLAEGRGLEYGKIAPDPWAGRKS
jgi:hypothetical protein